MGVAWLESELQNYEGWNRGADFVKCLALAWKRVRTRHLTRLRAPHVSRQACSHPSCSLVSAAIGIDIHLIVCYFV